MQNLTNIEKQETDYTFKWLKEERLKKGYTLASAAAQANISTSTYAAWESGLYLVKAAYANGKSSVLQGIEKVTGATRDEIVKEIRNYLCATGRLAPVEGSIQTELNKIIERFRNGEVIVPNERFMSKEVKDLIITELERTIDIINLISNLR